MSSSQPFGKNYSERARPETIPKGPTTVGMRLDTRDHNDVQHHVETHLNGAIVQTATTSRKITA